MANLTFAGAALRTLVAIGIAGGGITAATAQTASPMGGMKMAPGSNMDMKGMSPTASSTHAATTPRTATHHGRAQHHSHASRHHHR